MNRRDFIKTGAVAAVAAAAQGVRAEGVLALRWIAALHRHRDAVAEELEALEAVHVVVELPVRTGHLAVAERGDVDVLQ